MADIKIEYDDDFGINTFKREIISRFGEDRWNIITEGIEVPDINREGSCGCRNMVVFMENFRNYIDEESGKEILTNVRHGLRPSQCSWAREKFLECGDLDKFIEINTKNDMDEFKTTGFWGEFLWTAYNG